MNLQLVVKADRKADFKWPKIYDLGLMKYKNWAEMDQGSVFSLCEVFYICNGLKWRYTSTTITCGRVQEVYKKAGLFDLLLKTCEQKTRYLLE